ncbi:MAG: tRNA (adenosine(37)-N6)-threonylcarbamoyltransferase complex dimerization subunit type 1 TsaB [Patescibacteria group bacterium]|nr:tRNA (adenosine(37)-N6)-threonylcarbamoyltransferase complex dimerization subunit type 1 TsaB [Patescibacteria group bacterium]MCL5431522.1 tRNA (adenosine(37)-N6)-threonylcarbamoyltransferase complex dimerization subunit type 1 TsaB [Patescibacteria group bacterium]
MKLYIDTSSNQRTVVRLGERELVQSSRAWHSQVVLPMIKKLLTANSCQLKAIDEIEVNPGPGSFTGLRVGAAIAGALGYALKVPVNGLRFDKSPASYYSINYGRNA